MLAIGPLVPPLCLKYTLQEFLLTAQGLYVALMVYIG